MQMREVPLTPIVLRASQPPAVPETLLFNSVLDSMGSSGSQYIPFSLSHNISFTHPMKHLSLNDLLQIPM